MSDLPWTVHHTLRYLVDLADDDASDRGTRVADLLSCVNKGLEVLHEEAEATFLHDDLGPDLGEVGWHGFCPGCAKELDGVEPLHGCPGCDRMVCTDCKCDEAGEPAPCSGRCPQCRVQEREVAE